MSLEPGSAADRLDVTTPSGGILTREVGAITGEVQLWLDPTDPERVLTCYLGAEDVYTVVGSAEGRSLDELAEVLTHDPGVDADGNPRATRL